MELWLKEIAHYVALSIEAVAILLIAIGALEALVDIVRVGLRSKGRGHERRAVWLNFARWLVAGMTFQLAADVISTSFEPSMEQLIRLGAIAAIRTFLSYFLDREMEMTREQQNENPVER